MTKGLGIGVGPPWQSPHRGGNPLGMPDRAKLSTSSAPVKGPKVRNPNAGGGGHGGGKSGGGKGRGRGRGGGGGGGLGAMDFGCWIYDQPSGTDGGTSVNTTHNIVALDTELVNEISGASLASNKVTLPAGTYWMRGMSPILSAVQSRMAIWNDTDSAFELLGLSTRTAGETIVQGRVVLSDTKDIELQRYSNSGKATDGMGQAATNGVLEVYGTLMVWKES